MQLQLHPNAVRPRSRLRRNAGPIFGRRQSTERRVDWIIVRRLRIHERLENAGLLVSIQSKSFHARGTRIIIAQSFAGSRTNPQTKCTYKPQEREMVRKNTAHTFILTSDVIFEYT